MSVCSNHRVACPGAGAGAGAGAGEPGAGGLSEGLAVWVDVLGQVAGVCSVPGCCAPVVPGSASPATSPATPVTGSAPGSCSSATFLSWDITAPAPRLLGAGGVPVSLGAQVRSEVTGVRGVDPFGLSPVVASLGAGSVGAGSVGAGLSALTGLSASVASGLPGSSALPGSLLGLTAAGSLALGGLEVLGARVYDAQVRGFLSVDPVAAPVGAGWASNGYGFVGFSPVGLVDPWGLSPMSAAEFRKYHRAHSAARAWVQYAQEMKGLAEATWEWTKNNWQYVAAGAVVFTAAILTVTPAAPLGISILLNMGIGGLVSTGMQAAEKGWDLSQVDYKKVALDSAIMGIAGPFGAGAGAFAASRGLGLVGRTAAAEMASGGAQGALTYALDPSIESKSWSGFAGYTASGVVSGGVQGGVASKTKLLLNQRLNGAVAPGQVAWHLPATAAASGAIGGGLGGGLNYAGQQVSTGQEITGDALLRETVKGGLQSGLSSFDVKNLKQVGEIPVMEGVNLGSYGQGAVVAPSLYNNHIVVNGDFYVSPVTGQKVYSMPGSLNGMEGEFRVVVEQVDGLDVIRRQVFVPKG